jgi:hypothetical protein
MVSEHEGGNTRDRALGRLLQPATVAIVGMSAKPNTAGHLVLHNFRTNDFAGDIHLIGRSGGEVDGLAIRTDMADLPEGVDVAVLTVPAARGGGGFGRLCGPENRCGRGVRLGLCRSRRRRSPGAGTPRPRGAAGGTGDRRRGDSIPNGALVQNVADAASAAEAIGYPAMADMMLTGRLMNIEEGCQLRLAQYVVPAGAPCRRPENSRPSSPATRRKPTG